MVAISNIIVSIIISILASLGMSNIAESTAQDAAVQFLDDMSQGKSEIIEEYEENEYVNYLENILAENESTAGIRDIIYDSLDYEVIETASKNKVAVAKVKIINKDYSKVLEQYEKDSHDFLKKNLYEEDITNKDKLNQRCVEIYAEEVADAANADKNIEREIFIPMEMEGLNSWHIMLNDEVMKALVGNLEVLDSVDEESSEDEAMEDTSAGVFANDLREIAVDKILSDNGFPSYTYNEVQSLDMSKPSGVSIADLKLVTRHKLVGTEETLYNLEQNYNINALFLLAIASHESAYGTSQFHKNNVCGYGSSSYDSIDDCLDYVGRALAKYYLDSSGPYFKGKTIDDVNKTYAADPAWDSKVAKKVQYFYQVISESKKAQVDKLK